MKDSSKRNAGQLDVCRDLYREDPCDHHAQDVHDEYYEDHMRRKEREEEEFYEDLHDEYYMRCNEREEANEDEDLECVNYFMYVAFTLAFMYDTYIRM